MPNDKKSGLPDPTRTPPLTLGSYGYVIRLLGWVLEGGGVLMVVWRSHVVNQIYKWQWKGAGL